MCDKANFAIRVRATVHKCNDLLPLMAHRRPESKYPRQQGILQSWFPGGLLSHLCTRSGGGVWILSR